MKPARETRRLLILVGSPRRDGNSALLARAVVDGATAAGTDVSLQFLDDYITGMLTDTRHVMPVEDRYGELFLQQFLPADGVIFCTPVYWYNMSAQLKAFFDRSFTYYSASYSAASEVKRRMLYKRLGLIVVSEEIYPDVATGIVHQIQEYARYTRSEFVSFIHGIGNSRGEVAHDPRDPVGAAKILGKEFFTKKYSDYHIDDDRSGNVWW